MENNIQKPKQSQLMTLLSQSENLKKDVKPIENAYSGVNQMVTQGYNDKSNEAVKKAEATTQETDKVAQGLQVDQTAYKNKEAEGINTTNEYTKLPSQSTKKPQALGLQEASSNTSQTSSAVVQTPATQAKATVQNIQKIVSTPVKAPGAPLVNFTGSNATGRSFDQILKETTPNYTIDQTALTEAKNNLFDHLSGMNKFERDKLAQTADPISKRMLEEFNTTQADLSLENAAAEGTSLMKYLGSKDRRTTENIGDLSAVGLTSDNNLMNALNSQLYQDEAVNLRQKAFQELQNRDMSTDAYVRKTDELKNALKTGSNKIEEEKAKQLSILDILAKDDRQQSDSIGANLDSDIKSKNDIFKTQEQTEAMDAIDKLHFRPAEGVDYTEADINKFYDEYISRATQKYGEDSPVVKKLKDKKIARSNDYQLAETQKKASKFLPHINPITGEIEGVIPGVAMIADDPEYREAYLRGDVKPTYVQPDSVQTYTSPTGVTLF